MVGVGRAGKVEEGEREEKGGKEEAKKIR